MARVVEYRLDNSFADDNEITKKNDKFPTITSKNMLSEITFA